MRDPALFAFGAAVFTIAFTGAWVFLYARFFRPLYMRQNNRKDRVGAAAPRTRPGARAPR